MTKADLLVQLAVELTYKSGFFWSNMADRNIPVCDILGAMRVGYTREEKAQIFQKWHRSGTNVTFDNPISVFFMNAPQWDNFGAPLNTEWIRHLLEYGFEKLDTPAALYACSIFQINRYGQPHAFDKPITHYDQIIWQPS